MPFTSVGATAAIAVGLLGTGQIGTGMPKFAAAVGQGTDSWIHAVTVTTVDVGTIGVGTGTIPITIPTPILIANLTAAFVGQGILGVLAPLLILGLSNGLTVAFLQALVVTVHPSVGVGTAVVRFGSTPAVPLMISAFAAHGMVSQGSIKTATAIGLGLSNSFGVFTTVSPIVGGVGPSSSAGAGTGTIV